jgi:hypothetical protein
MAMLESLDIYTTSIVLNGSGSWANDLHLPIVGMPKLRIFRISIAFRGDMTDGDCPLKVANLPPHPINYPYKAHVDIDSPGQANCLSLKKGDKGKVLQTSDKNMYIILPRLSLDTSG